MKNSSSKIPVANLRNLIFVTLCLSSVLCAAVVALGASAQRPVLGTKQQTKQQTTQQTTISSASTKTSVSDTVSPA